MRPSGEDVMKEIYIKDLYSPDFKSDNEIVLYGWIKSVRKTKKTLFIDLQDSSGTVQVVISAGSPSFEKPFKPEQSVKVTGRLRTKQPAGKIEIVATGAEIMGDVKKVLSPTPRSKFDIFDNRYTEYVQTNRHLFIRNDKVMAALRARDLVKNAVYDWFKSQGFIEITAPILTPILLYTEDTGIAVRVKDQDLFLTQCVAFYLESAVHAFEKVFNIGPSFRGAESISPRHLTEYWHVKAEIAFCPFEEMFGLIESLVSFVAKRVEPYSEEICKTLEIKPCFSEASKTPFPRIEYRDAIKLCRENGIDVSFGKSLSSRAEAFLTEHFDSPVWVTHNARTIEGFPYKICEFDRELTYTADLIGSCGGGEILGIADKITDYDELTERLKEKGKAENEKYEWFRELRDYGTVPHCGVGMGLERLIKWLYGLPHVREAIPFPRSIGRIIYP